MSRYKYTAKSLKYGKIIIKNEGYCGYFYIYNCFIK